MLMLASRPLLFFKKKKKKTGEEMETMTAGAWEGVDLMGLMQIWSHPHPPQFSSLISQNLH